MSSRQKKLITYGSAGSTGRVVRFLGEHLGTLSFVSRVKVGVVRTIQGDTGKDKEEGMGDKGGRVRRKAQGLAQVAGEEVLRGVIGNGQGSCDTDNVLGARAPPGLVDFTSNVLVEEAVVHL